MRIRSLSESESVFPQVRAQILQTHNYALIGQAVACRMPEELHPEFQTYIIAMECLYDSRRESRKEIKVMAEWVGEAYTSFIHKAEDLRQAEHI